MHFESKLLNLCAVNCQSKASKPHPTFESVSQQDSTDLYQPHSREIIHLAASICLCVCPFVVCLSGLTGPTA